MHTFIYPAVYSIGMNKMFNVRICKKCNRWIYTDNETATDKYVSNDEQHYSIDCRRLSS